MKLFISLTAVLLLSACAASTPVRVAAPCSAAPQPASCVDVAAKSYIDRENFLADLRRGTPTR